MTNKFFNDAIIGNKKIIATFSKTGELLRMVYPGVDFRQFIDFFKTGVKINDSDLVNLNDDINNHYSQNYLEDTNILKTTIENTYFNLEIEQVDFVPMKENVLIKQYTFHNHHSIDLDISLLIHSKLHSDLNNKVGGMELNQALIQYCHDYRFAIFSKNPMEGYQINNSDATILSGEIGGKDYIGMSTDSSIKYKVGVIKPGESKIICLFVSAKEYKEKEKLEQLEQEINEIRKMDVKKELATTKRYWNKFVEEHKGNFSLKEIDTEYARKVQKIYHRSILLYALLINETTGGISAAVEADDRMEKSGGYAYCWPRDAIYICGALDKLKMEKQTEKFYKIFCKMTQNKNGMWEQRFYTDGKLAPCWGLQIDETASVVYGVLKHYDRFSRSRVLRR